jgi:predicted MPP superfamily phosphohydrolase
MFQEVKTIPKFREERLNRGRVKAKSYHYCKLSPTFAMAKKNGVKRVIAMSDIHSMTADVVDWLISTRRITPQTVVITTGDMAGNGRLGEDGDPLQQYIRLRDAALALYFVQGNHDDFNPQALALRNSDGTPCCVDGDVIQTPLGAIGGVNGITVLDEHVEPAKHKLSAVDYNAQYRRVLSMGPTIMLTHQPVEREDMAANCIHLFGHAHHDNYADYDETTLSLNMDGRVFQFD